MVGSPGDDGLFDEYENAGAVWTYDVPTVSTYVFNGPANDALWSVPSFWDTQVVPGPGDTAIVPESLTVIADGVHDVGQLLVEGQLRVSGAVNTSSAAIAAVGAVVVVEDGEFGIEGELVLDGDLTVDPADDSQAGTVYLTDTLVSGSGELVLNGDLVTGGAVSFGPSVVLTSSGTSVIEVAEPGGLLTVGSDYTENGRISVGPDAEVEFLGEFTAIPAAVLESRYDGPSSNGLFVFGQAGVPAFNGATLRATNVGEYLPLAPDTFVVATCNCGSGDVTLDIDPLSATVFADRIELAAPPAVLTVDTLDDTVAADSVCSLREAITAANLDSPFGGCVAGSGDDTIYFDVTGTIALGSRLPIVTSDITFDGTDQAVIIDGQTTDGNNGTPIARINAGGNLTLVEMTLTRGRSQGCDGGDTCGAVLNYGVLDVVDSTFSNNQGNTFANGIAITNRGGGRLDVTGSTFVNNRGDSSGAIWNASDASNTLTVATVTNSTFVGNSAGGGSAGAIYNTFNASLTINNTTFSANGGGTTLSNAGGAAAVVLRNSVITGSTSGAGLACAGGPYTANSSNIDTDGTCGGATTSGSLNLDVLADNGGPTQTVMLLAGSAAIGAGDAAVCSASPVDGVDQRGVARPIGPDCDAGAVESSLTSPGTLTVNDTGDASDASPGDSRCETATNNGVCTLSAAIEEANANAAIDTIEFDIPGPGVHRIAPTDRLPAITAPVTIDGYSQPGASRNTLAVGNDAVLLIEINGQAAPGGNNAGSDRYGLFVTATGSNTTITGLVVNGFSDGTWGEAIKTQYAEGVVIEGNFIGTDPTGAFAVPNTQGVRFDDISSRTAPHRVGGPDPAQRNVISGNLGYGIWNGRWDIGKSNVIQGNYIGTNAAGTAPIGNLQAGIFVEVTTTPLIGGTGAGEGNLISGNNEGIRTQESPATILGNLIGTDPTGLSPLPNTYGIQTSQGFGVGIAQQIGDGTAAGRNVISGNTGAGVYADQVVVMRGNYVGVGVDGTTALGNSGFGGVRIASSNNTIGGRSAGDGNVIANNSVGVTIAAGVNNSVVGNRIFANSGLGLSIAGAGANDAGDADTGPNNLQNHPEIVDSKFDGTDLAIEFSIDSLPGSSTYPIQIDFYVADGLASGEGALFVGSTSVAAPGSDTVELLGVSDVDVGDLIVATATDANGNTSQFSPARAVDAAPTVPTFVGGGVFAPWNVPANWSTGAVPGPDDTAVVPAGSSVSVNDSVSIGNLVVEGTAFVNGELFVNGDSTIAATGLLSVRDGGIMTLGAVLTTESGGQLTTTEGPPNGIIIAATGARFAGAGLVGNSGTVRFAGSGVIPIDPDITWNSGTNSVIEVASGTLDIESLAFDTQGRFLVAPERCCGHRTTSCSPTHRCSSSG